MALVWIDVARNATSLCRSCLQTGEGSPPNRIHGGELRVGGAASATTPYKQCYHVECFKTTGPPWLEGVADVEAEVEGHQLAGSALPAIRARLANQPSGCLHPQLVCWCSQRGATGWALSCLADLLPGSRVTLRQWMDPPVSPR